MRVEFARAIVELAKEREDLIFLSGDLGFMALEEVQACLGSRFVNTGVAEQNMVSVAAGLAASGYVPIVYSIAPFATMRPYEQIRINACLHNLPVKIVGNGGGYGYGIMGSTHHALEDVAIMRVLPHMRVYTPAFGHDVAKVVRKMLDQPGPSYLRLGKSVASYGESVATTPWAGFQRVSRGNSLVVVGMGPVIENVLALLPELPPNTIDLWSVGEFPICELPDEFASAVERTRRIMTIEEHYCSGGLAENMAFHLVNFKNLKFTPLFANGYESGSYGSQKWHQEENGLAGIKLRDTIRRSLAA